MITHKTKQPEEQPDIAEAIEFLMRDDVIAYINKKGIKLREFQKQILMKDLKIRELQVELSCLEGKTQEIILSLLPLADANPVVHHELERAYGRDFKTLYNQFVIDKRAERNKSASSIPSFSNTYMGAPPHIQLQQFEDAKKAAMHNKGKIK